MDLALTEDQRMIRDAAASYLADASGPAAVRMAMATDSGFDPALWHGIGDMGWCGTAVPENFDGLGLGPLEQVLILEQMGRHLVCAPYFASIALAANLLVQVGSAAAKKKYLPLLAKGALCATAKFDAAGLRAKKVKSGWQASGRVDGVVDGASAELLLLPSGATVFAIRLDAAGVKRRPLTTWDATRRFADVELKSVSAERVDDPARKSGLARAESLARLYLAAEQLGGAQRCLDLTLRYISERKQFGRAIASFQAVKHRCAQMMVKIEGLRSAVYGAAACAAGHPDTRTLALECAMARALAADTFFHCSAEAIQLHGGVGFTWEFEPQLYFKRAQAGAHWLGTASAMREQIAQALL